MTTASPFRQMQLDEMLTVQLQVGQLRECGSWVSYAPSLDTLAQDDTQETSLANLCVQIEEFCDFLLRTGRPLALQAISVEDSLRSYTHRKTIHVRVPRYAQLLQEQPCACIYLKVIQHQFWHTGAPMWEVEEKCLLKLLKNKALRCGPLQRVP